LSSKCKAKKLAMLCFLSLVSEIVLLDCFRAVECMSARRTKQGLLTTKSSYVEEKDGVVKLCCCMPACLLAWVLPIDDGCVSCNNYSFTIGWVPQHCLLGWY